MQEIMRYGVGIDVGTTHVRCVIGHLDDAKSAATVVGVGQSVNSGMRKGAVVNIIDTAHAVDKALEEAERMSGHQVHSATVSINGVHIASIASKGVVAVNSQNNEITEEDILRVNDAATVVNLPANREILQVTPQSYKLDDQTNIKDPLGMTGVRLEVDAHVVTALSPNIKNLLKSLEMTQTNANNVVVAGLGAAKSALTPKQMENGVALVDFGGTTTQIVVYEENDLQHVAVLPMGSVNITNDLAIGLRTDLEIAEDIKLKHVSKLLEQSAKEKPKHIEYEVGGKKVQFSVKEIKMIVEARLDEIFELIDKELKKIGKSGKLPGGVVLCGAGSNLGNIAEYAKNQLQLPARLAHSTNIGGMSEKVTNPEFATALGLMLIDLEGGQKHQKNQKSMQADKMFGKLFNSASSFMKRFRP